MGNVPAQRLTPEQQEEARELVRRMRVKAVPVGPLHAFWDGIFDLEALLDGSETFLDLPPDEYIDMCRDWLTRTGCDEE